MCGGFIFFKKNKFINKQGAQWTFDFITKCDIKIPQTNMCETLHKHSLGALYTESSFPSSPSSSVAEMNKKRSLQVDDSKSAWSFLKLS